MKNIRCNNCNKLLAKAIFIQIEIKCPRCRHINTKSECHRAPKPLGDVQNDRDTPMRLSRAT
ncbi:Com family DNA-binding transcriptional regulator [Gammaproteobacteria bacterium AS21]